MLSTMEALLVAAIGIVAGAVGGVLTAAPIARRAARSNERYELRAQIHKALRTYGATIAYIESMLPRRSYYPADYADLPGQYQLCEAVLEPAALLPRRTQRILREGLLQLVGTTTLEACERAVGVPAEQVDVELQRTDRALAQTKAVHHPEIEDTSAYLRRLVTNHFDAEAREAALATLDRMAKAVRP